MQKHREDAPSLTSQVLRHRQASGDVIGREYLAHTAINFTVSWPTSWYTF